MGATRDFGDLVVGIEALIASEMSRVYGYQQYNCIPRRKFILDISSWFS
jgi:hypothetical protein